MYDPQGEALQLIQTNPDFGKEFLGGAAAATIGLPGELEYLARVIAQIPGLARGAKYQDPKTGLPRTDRAAEMIGADLDTAGGAVGQFWDFTGPMGKLLGAIASVAPVVAKAAKTGKAAGKPDAQALAEVLKSGEVSSLPATSLQAADFSGNTTTAAKNVFAQRQAEARNAMSEADRAQVDQFNPEGFQGQVFLNDDGTAGFTMTDDGYVGNLFRHPGANIKGTIGAALTKARAAGAKNLEAFDTYLVRNYVKHGAEETGRFPWDPSMASDEIIRGLGDQKPDFVQMNIGGVFPERKFSNALGDRGQSSLVRRRTTPTGREVAEPKTVSELFTPENIDRTVEIFHKGRGEGGDRWYWLGGMLDRFIEEHGAKEGVRRFDGFMELNAALSPRSTVSQEIKRASVLYQRWLKDQPITPLSHAMFPPGYGHMGTTTAHAPGVDRFVETGYVGDPRIQPKTPSYSANLQGNYRPLTADTHNFQIWSGQSRSPSGTEYPFMEQRQTKIAEELGIDPAEFQSGLWVGGKDITGVADTKNFTAQMNQRIAATAEFLGIPEVEAMIRWMNGDIILRGLVGAIGAGAIASVKDEKAQGAGEQ